MEGEAISFRKCSLGVLGPGKGLPFSLRVHEQSLVTTHTLLGSKLCLDN